jgi:hypothetical protein
VDQRPDRRRPGLAEEYLTGPEFGVETLSLGAGHEFLLMAERQTVRPHFVEVGYQVPAPAHADRARRDRGAGRPLPRADRPGHRPGAQPGQAHRARPRLLGARTTAGGEQAWELCRLAGGADAIGETVAALADVPRPPRVPTAGGAAVRFFDYEDVRVLKVSGLEEAADARGVVRFACSLEGRPGARPAALRELPAGLRAVYGLGHRRRGRERRGGARPRQGPERAHRRPPPGSRVARCARPIAPRNPS